VKFVHHLGSQVPEQWKQMLKVKRQRLIGKKNMLSDYSYGEILDLI
jgi:hypothetical protein